MKYLNKLSDTEYILLDHANGFDVTLRNTYLDLITVPAEVQTEYMLNQVVKDNYPHLTFTVNSRMKKQVLGSLGDYNVHPDLKFTNFLCSFNNSYHVSRALLTSLLNCYGWYNRDYVSKNFITSADSIDGHVVDYVGDKSKFYSKFFAASEEFHISPNQFGEVVKFAHGKNIYNLEHKLVNSFVHVVSETNSTSYYPFVTEKFLYSVVTRGVFVSYAQPNWHSHIEQYFGFKPYTKLFNYQFDSITNPIDRLLELFSMLSKFSRLSTNDWYDLYQLESSTIEYNLDNYRSGDYLKELEISKCQN